MTAANHKSQIFSQYTELLVVVTDAVAVNSPPIRIGDVNRLVEEDGENLQGRTIQIPVRIECDLVTPLQEQGLLRQR
jgi:hypothetical protein